MSVDCQQPGRKDVQEELPKTKMKEKKGRKGSGTVKGSAIKSNSSQQYGYTILFSFSFVRGNPHYLLGAPANSLHLGITCGRPHCLTSANLADSFARSQGKAGSQAFCKVVIRQVHFIIWLLLDWTRMCSHFAEDAPSLHRLK